MFFFENKNDSIYIFVRIFKETDQSTMLSVISSVFLIFIVVLDQFNDGMIIGECQQPNEWKTWLNVNRPTALGLFAEIG